MRLPTVPKSVFLFLLLSCHFLFTANAEQAGPLNRPFNREILDHYRAKSNEYVARNLNRFALERLYVYDRLLDSLYIREKTDTLAVIQSNYKSTASSRLNEIDTLRKSIATLSAEKKKLDDRYWALIRYAIFSFIIWLVLVLIFLKFRQRKMRKSEMAFQSSSTQLETLEDLSQKAGKLFTDFRGMRQTLDKMLDETGKLEMTIASNKDNPKKAAAMPAIIAQADKLRKGIETERKIIDAVLDQSVSDTSEKTVVDINSLCDAYMEIAYRGMEKSETFNCQVSRDFEKKLPGIKVNQSAVGTLLLNILSNAFQSVKDKSAKGIKGYQPKVSISTRILPRFLQVRVKDNGVGMNDHLLQSAGNEFFSTRPVNEGPGLGLNIAKAVMADHKGEIKIESEEGNSTDVYIKFFI